MLTCRSIRDLNDRCYWQYIIQDSSEIEIFQQKCKNSSRLSTEIYLKEMEDILGASFHPNLKRWIQDIPSVPQQQASELLKNLPDHPQSKKYKHLQFNSIMVDDLTFKVLNQIVALENVISYKFINNELSDLNLLSLIDLIDMNTNLRKLQFHYNKSRVIRLLEIGNFKNIVYLSLKSNNITDKCIDSLVENLTSSSEKLRYLDLHDNKITLEGALSLIKVVEINCIEFIGLGKNCFKGIKDIESLFKFSQLNEISEAEKQDYQKLLADKNMLTEMIAKRKKPPKRLQELKIPLDIIKHNNLYYRVKKPSLTLLSLIDNGFKQTAEELTSVIQKIQPKLQIYLMANAYADTLKDSFKDFPNVIL